MAPENVKGVLADKIHRPYARCHLSTAGRVGLLQEHYQQLARFFPTPVAAALVAGKRFPLVRFTGKAPEDRYLITVSREMMFQHQGELTFLMIDEVSGVALVRLIVNLAGDSDRLNVILNGIQGPGVAHKKAIVQATRHLNGLRPKRAVLEVACAMARWMKADSLVAITIENHVSRAKKKWVRKVVADYDDFWRECDPQILANGDYQLPLTMPRRKLDDVIPKKRKDWHERCKKLDYISEVVTQSLPSIAAGTITPLQAW
jgi:uncharacterized protein VirK/YbjX